MLRCGVEPIPTRVLLKHSNCELPAWGGVEVVCCAWLRGVRKKVSRGIVPCRHMLFFYLQLQLRRYERNENT